MRKFFRSDADKIKELEKEVEALKVQQWDELEAALSRLEAARSTWSWRASRKWASG